MLIPARHVFGEQQFFQRRSNPALQQHRRLDFPSSRNRLKFCMLRAPIGMST
jgi:hypothetical protein